MVIMAGLDPIDPANLCVPSSAIQGLRGPYPRMTVGWVTHLIEKCQSAGWTREFPWSEKTSCTSKPESCASFAC
jgi:hypothetical protein